jgi:polysaccharide biosynthesis transport protein
MAGDQPAPAYGQKSATPGELLAVLLRRRWFFFAPLFAVGLAGFALSNLLPLEYRCSAFIMIEQRKVPEQYVAPNVLITLQKRLDSMTQQILSRTRLQRFIQDFNLYSAERKTMPMDDVIDRMRKRITIELAQTKGRQNDTTGFRIFFSDRDPYVAQRVTNELASLFIEEDTHERTSQSQRTTAFLQGQLEEARQELASEEEQVRGYKLKHPRSIAPPADNALIRGQVQSQDTGERRRLADHPTGHSAVHGGPPGFRYRSGLFLFPPLRSGEPSRVPGRDHPVPGYGSQ